MQQIFGRAGRPQFEDEGLGIIITQHAQLSHYLGMLTHQTPIESQFTKGLVDNLNAEIVLGGCAASFGALIAQAVSHAVQALCCKAHLQTCSGCSERRWLGSCQPRGRHLQCWAVLIA